MSASILVNEGTQVKEKLLGLMSKTGADAQENIFMKKVVPIYKSLPFFFKPIQDGTTNPRMELAFREPSKRITKDTPITHGELTKKEIKKARTKKYRKGRIDRFRKKGGTRKKWSMKYKKSINCRKPKGFSQKQYCKYGRKKQTRRRNKKNKNKNKKK